MALPPITRVASVSAAVLGITVSTYALIVYNKVSKTKMKHITAFNDIPESFRRSDTLRKIVNPRGHTESTDTRFSTLDIPASHHHLTDEILLAHFVKRFYNGWVFAPERYLLRLLRKNFVGFAETSSFPEPTQVWDVSTISELHLPPPHTVILGNWQVMDVSLAKSSEVSGDSESSIDIAFGNDNWPFAGSNRFSIERRNVHQDGEERAQVRLVYASFCCNPLVDKRPIPGFMKVFHNSYAMLLYREAMGGVCELLQKSTQSVVSH